MRLGTKHANQQTVVRADFSGGLNTSTTPDNIAENQLAMAINIEIDHATGRLKTVGGTTDIVQTPDIFALLYDQINDTFLIVKQDKAVYPCSLSGELGEAVGILSGDLYPITASWEDGLLIATGGKLQYYHGGILETIDSPTANSVYIRAGRVLITDDTQIRYSGVGDETNWTEDTNDASSSKFVEAGYKDGGKFIGMSSLSQDVLMFKDNRRVYRLSGEYPNWVISEVSRQVECNDRLSFADIADAVFVLGANEVITLQTTDNYGAMKPAAVSNLVTSEIVKLPVNAKVRYVPPLSQVWFIGDNGDVLMFDLSVQSWYMRKFNAPLIDVISVGSTVVVAKSDRISIVDDTTFYDSGLPLEWRFQAGRMVSQHDYLLKRTQISVIPLSPTMYSGEIRVGAVVIGLPVPTRWLYIYGNKSPIFKNHVKLKLAGRNMGVYVSGEKIWQNPDIIYNNRTKIYSIHTFIKESRNVYRSKYLNIEGRGNMGGFILNGIILDIAEV